MGCAELQCDWNPESGTYERCDYAPLNRHSRRVGATRVTWSNAGAKRLEEPATRAGDS